MRRLHPSTLVVAFVPRVWDAVKTFLPALFISLASGKQDFTEMVIAGMGLLGGFGVISTYFTTLYGIEGNELLWRSGWLFKRDRRILLEHVNNVSMRQGLLERLFKVVTVEVETAAGTGAELRLQALSFEDAERLKSELLVAIGEKKSEGPSADEVYTVSKKDLWLGAMTENNGLQLILLSLGLFGVAAVVWVLRLSTSLSTVLPAPVMWALVVLIGLLIVFGGWVYGAVAYVFRFGGFKVRAEGTSFRISHGLLSKHQYVLRTERVEFATITATIWQKWIGRTTLRVGTAGTFGEHGGVMPLALMAPESYAQKVVQQLLNVEPLERLPWTRFPRYYIAIILIRAFIGLAVLGGVGYLFSLAPGLAATVPGVFVLVIALLVVVGTLEELLSFSVSGYAVTDELLAVRTGFFNRKTMMMPIMRVEVVGTSEPPWWRRRAVTTLAAHGMVHAVAIPMLPQEVAKEVADKLSGRAPAFPLTVSPVSATQ